MREKHQSKQGAFIKEKETKKKKDVLVKTENTRGFQTDLPFTNTVRVDDGDHAGAERGAAAGAVRCALLVRSACRYGAGQLGDNFTHNCQAGL